MFDFIKKRRDIFNIILVTVLIALIIPGKGKFRYQYQKGRPWLYESLIAPIDFPVLKNIKELREEREAIASSVVPYYKHKSGIAEEQIKSLKSGMALTGNDSLITEFIFQSIKYVYSKGVMEDMPDTTYNKGIVAIVKEDKTTLHPARNLYTTKSASEFIKSVFDNKYPGAIELSNRLISSLALQPNLIFDNSLTQMVLKEQIANISPTKGKIYTGQLIISNGETVTAESEQLLDSYKSEYDVSMGFTGNKLLLKLGQLLVVIAVIVIFILTLKYLDKELLESINKLNFLLVQFILVSLSTVLVLNSGFTFLYVIPYGVIALYLTSFFKSKIVLPLYSIFLIPVIFMTPDGFEIYFLKLVAGAAIFFSFNYFDRGWRQFVNSVIAFMALSITYISLRMIEDGTFQSLESDMFIYFAWNSVLIIAAYPLLYLFEKIFGLVSNSRLRDFSDVTSKLLTSLAEKAPGTFHHSLQVANLSESAAREIGAYALLTRVGALYHDIGKMSNPSFFIENLPLGEANQHNDLPPEESAGIIIRHVEEGVKIAAGEKIPQIISDFIITHHGCSRTGYFYNQYLNNGGDPANEHMFTYKGELPKTKEQVIVMLADAVEASSRTLKDYSKESISALVDKMVDDRIKEKQLENSDISLNEINIIKSVFKQKLGQVYHSRVKYPGRKRSSKPKQNGTQTVA